MSSWPQLREELALYKSSIAADGSPSWTLHDPARNLYFRIDWLTFEVLSQWHLQDATAICTAIETETTLEPDVTDVEGIVRFLLENELIQRHGEQDTRWFLEQKARHKTSPLTWLLHRYLFFRVPLWKPDAWLQSTQWLVRPFYTRRFFMLTFIVLWLGLFEAARQWERFTATLVDTFTLNGLVAFLITLVFVKFFHELGHAYTAKRFGCRVPAMGVAFLVLFPMAYTDVNEVWKLRQRRQRLCVGAAGVTTELLIAVWALLVWTLLPDGYLRTGAFLLATTTWISTILINASPFLRFDGYFLLMDWLDMPNLHQRAFALGRWRLRELLFRLNEPVPEYLPEHRRRGVILFAWFTWLYRLVVFVGIALLVYWLVPKPLGPFLTAVELTWFIGRPVWNELKEWGRRMPIIIRSPRLGVLGLVFAGVLLLLIWPWDARISAQGLLQPRTLYTLYAPSASMLTQVYVQSGEKVEAEQVLMVLDNPDLNIQQAQLEPRLNTLLWQEQRVGMDSRLLERRHVLAADRAKVEAERVSISDEQKRNTLRSPYAGLYFALEQNLKPGIWLAASEPLGVVADPGQWQVETFLSEADLERVREQNRAHFYPETPSLRRVDLKVVRIDKDATRSLQSGELALGRGGRIAVRRSASGDLVPEQSIYRVVLEPVGHYQPETAQIQRGRVVILGEPRSIMSRYWRTALAVIIREANF
ncbi:HlyD family efflux transporter periplasmic adaptor subunit [Nitrincola sp. MINF-07-Sa-05]|uniref:HlyD family efflux transporter periplasmic adaptor subunit n=1 Tax=Nitrincola salilacus TaxID=3400273 RepID=UPI003917CED3